MMIPDSKETVVSPTLHFTIAITVVVFVCVLVFSVIAKIEVVARGKGRIVPVSRVQSVQSEFSGQITSIKVRNGDHIQKGDILIELNATDAMSELGMIIAETDRLLIEGRRIDASVIALEKNPGSKDYRHEILNRFAIPDYLSAHPFRKEQEALLRAEILDIMAAYEQISAQEATNHKAQQVIKANINRVSVSLSIQSKRLYSSRHLLSKGTISQASFLDVKQTTSDLEQQHEIYLRELDQKVAEKTTFIKEFQRALAEKRQNLMMRKAEINSRLAILEKEETAAHRRVKAAKLIAPSTGTVNQLQVFTIGGIAEAGAELLRIVPSDLQIEIEASFSNQDIGFMRKGQMANIRLDAFPSERFGYVKGQVSDISADSTKSEKEQWNYVVRVKPYQSYLEAGLESYKLRPGMTATIDVITDYRRVIGYFFAPIVRTVQDAIKER